MSSYKYSLEPYKGMKSRYTCPGCGKQRAFTRYVNTETGEHLAHHVGRCSREVNCAYHYKPRQYFQDNNFSLDTPRAKGYRPRPLPPQPKPVSFIPVEVFKASLNPEGMEGNHFVKFLIGLFGVEVASDLVSRYFIASSNHWGGSTVFWQIDTQGKVRTGKIMLYSPTTGKRVKEPFNHITWVHKALKQPEFELKQCLFGEHLLMDRTKPVAIVESEKTAVIASGYLPQFIWLAVGSLTGLNPDRCKVLTGRTVVLFPDLNGFEKWSGKAKELSQFASFQVSDLLERKATDTERKQGLDLADYLTRFDFREFALPETAEPAPADQPLMEVKPAEQPEPVCYSRIPEQPKAEGWDRDIADLESYFAGIVLPAQPVKLNPCSTITDCTLFIGSHFANLRANTGKRTVLPFLNRLQELKKVLTTNLK